MLTFGTRFKNQFNEANTQLLELSTKHFDTDELKDLVSIIGARLELFLKSIIFTRKSSRDNFYSFINELLSVGFTQKEVKLFHDLRIQYNDSKHEPSYKPSITNIISLIINVLPLIEKLINLGLGITNNFIFIGLDRVFWIAGWDHYIGGDTEIHIMFPDYSGTFLGPPSLDQIYIDMKSWYIVKNDLKIIGVLKEDKGIIPEKLYKEWESEGEFLDAFVYEGNYKDLVCILSQYEKRNELVSGLMRHHDIRAMIQACLLATLDVITNTNNIEEKIIIEEIKSQAINVYAIPNKYKGLKQLVENISEMILKIEKNDWSKIYGLKWLDKNEYENEKKSALAICENYNILINSELIICIIGT